jgi:aminopeptidase N
MMSKTLRKPLLGTSRLANAIALALCTTAAFSPIGVNLAHAEAPFSFQQTPGKLPKNVLPIQYTAHLVPDLANNTFSGHETVSIQVLSPTRQIVLNVSEMEIDAASLSGDKLGTQTLTPLIDKEKQLLRFELAQELAPGNYELALRFHGSINRNSKGLYAIKYKENGQDKTMLATNMEPTAARRMLPLWDEPAFRATFKLSVDVPASFNAYSNTAIEKQETLANGLQRVSFGLTPKMSSYLVVLAAGETERISAMKDGVEIGIVTTKGKQASAAFALKSSTDLLGYFNSYFGVRYPLAKLDNIAVPGGFSGAMENWGGVIYNEFILLYDPQKSPESTKQMSFTVNAHETAHMWFGDLVTMAWWDNLWLNEGFANWMGSKAVAHFHPEWRTVLASTNQRDSVMNRDARQTTHPIQKQIDNEEQAEGAFDSITYEKGEAFLRMLEAYLGEATFQRGIQKYIAKHQYSNTTSADLWATLEQASGKPVAKLAQQWTTQPGFPLVQVAQSCKNGKRNITLTQHSFRADGTVATPVLWPVPVMLGELNGKAGKGSKVAKADYVLLDTASKTVVRPGCSKPLVVDPDSVGYYRVQYDANGLQQLSQHYASLPESARIKLVNDTWALVQADKLPLASFLTLAQQLKDEPRTAIWAATLTKLLGISKALKGEPEQPKMHQYLAKLAKPRLEQVGWDEKPGEPSEAKELREGLSNVLAEIGDPAAIARARSEFARFLQDPASVPASSLDFVIRVAGRYADQATWDSLHALLKKAKTTEEINRYVLALASAKDEKLAARTLPMVFDADLPAHMVMSLLPMVAQDQHIDQTWDFAMKNREALAKVIDANDSSRVLPGIFGGSSNVEHAKLLESWAKQNLSAEGQKMATRVAANIRVRAKRREELLPQIRAALQG